VVAGDQRFQVVQQNNAGQLSVFNWAAAEADPDDLVFFLDADDVWADDHLAIVSRALRGPLATCDFVFTEKWDTSCVEPFSCGVDPAKACHVLGTTSGVTRGFFAWIGNVTSTLCLRGSLLRRILPYPYAVEWKIRADDCLVLGASIANAVKGHIDAVTVLYRVHGGNNLHGSDTSGRAESPAYRVAKERFVNWLSDRESLDRAPSFRLVLSELALARDWLPYTAADFNPEWALVMPWSMFKRVQVSLAILRARWACRHRPLRGLRGTNA
jgi:glycosyltransferase involved in cell wall biosynthesis